MGEFLYSFYLRINIVRYKINNHRVIRSYADWRKMLNINNLQRFIRQIGRGNG